MCASPALAPATGQSGGGHEPDEAPAWMKAITTLVIRNSQLEDLHANGPVNAGGITAVTTYGLGPLSHLIAARRFSAGSIPGSIRTRSST